MDVVDDWNEEEEDVRMDSEMETSVVNQTKDKRPLLMKFCPHDSSMLYPKENKSNRTLEYACRLCPYTEYTSQPLIYRNAIKKEVGNILQNIPGNVRDDPTLPRSNKAYCVNCKERNAVFLHADTGQTDSLALVFVCCNCEYKWVNTMSAK